MKQMQELLNQKNLNMANICENTMYVESENRENLDKVIDFFDKEIVNYKFTDDNTSLDIKFNSKWDFPVSKMEELFESLPDQSDIYIRCLSVEYGLMYHALWMCDEDGWREC